ncbi:MAG: oligosaccharide flippase family protein [Longimicrobiales bacterium]|nr:oligosaccharide flippase family protein [Longimicrobiales bacterium]
MTGGSTAGTIPGDAGSRLFAMKSFGKHTLVYGLGILLSKAVSFIMLPIYTRYLTPADYGIMELIEMTLDIIAIAAGAKIAIGIFRYYHKAETQEEKDHVVSTALIILALSYATVAIGTILAAPYLSNLVFGTAEHTPLIRLAGASLGFSSLIVAPLAYIRVRKRSTLFVIANLAKLIIALSMNLVLVVWAEMGVKGVFISSLTANAIVGFWLGSYLVRQVGLHFSSHATASLLRYGVPLILTQVATFVATFGDRYFLQAQAGEAEVGIYSLAYKFGFLLLVVGWVPISSVWEPARFEMADRDDRDVIYARAFVLTNVSLISIALGLALFGGDVIRIMSDASFHSAGVLIPMIVVAYIFQAWTDFHDVGIHMREKTEVITLVNWICAGVAVGGYLLLIPRYGTMGAAVATVIAFAVRFGLIYLASWKLWPVAYQWRPVVTLVLLAGAVFAAGLAIPADLDPLVAILLRGGLYTLFVTSVWFTGVIRPGEKEAGLALVRGGARSIAQLLPGRATP